MAKDTALLAQVFSEDPDWNAAELIGKIAEFKARANFDSLRTIIDLHLLDHSGDSIPTQSTKIRMVRAQVVPHQVEGQKSIRLSGRFIGWTKTGRISSTEDARVCRIETIPINSEEILVRIFLSRPEARAFVLALAEYLRQTVGIGGETGAGPSTNGSEWRAAMIETLRPQDNHVLSLPIVLDVENPLAEVDAALLVVSKNANLIELHSDRIETSRGSVCYKVMGRGNEWGRVGELGLRVLGEGTRICVTIAEYPFFDPSKPDESNATRKAIDDCYDFYIRIVLQGLFTSISVRLQRGQGTRLPTALAQSTGWNDAGPTCATQAMPSLSLQLRPAGRPPNQSYDLAAERIRNGMDPKQAYEIFLKEEDIKTPDAMLRKSFRRAMRDRQKRTQNPSNK